MTSELPSSPRTEDDVRLRGLLDAHHRIADDRSLTSVLESVVRVACEVIGSRYGALGVLGPDGTLEHFVQHGLDSVPGTPLLGMPSFLNVPIRTHGAALGSLYLADPRPERFEPADEQLAIALAAMAGTAIENARLRDEARRSRDWLHASGEIARTLLSDGDDEVLTELIARALRVADADYACVIVPTEDSRMRVAAAIGVGARDFRGRVFDPADSVLGKAIVTAEGARTPDIALWARLDFDNRHDFGPAVIVPLVTHGDRGAVLMTRRHGRPPFTAHDLELAATFTAQVALAIELGDARAEADQVRTLEQSNRLARDLHDDVIQRLFATGLGLQALAEQLPDAELAARLRGHIAALDETLVRIRTVVFGLQPGVNEPS